MAASQTRDRLLDAVQTLLLDGGPATVTLEAVAADAGVSKGGLLYHFRTKDALLEGLLDRLAAVADQEVRQARAQGATARWYLENALPGEDAALYSSMIAVLKSADGANPELQAKVRDVFGSWAIMVREDVSDPVLAETICLVGDGIFFNALLGFEIPDPDTLGAINDRLLRQVEST